MYLALVSSFQHYDNDNNNACDNKHDKNLYGTYLEL
jgi:hypothetical protein